MFFSTPVGTIKESITQKLRLVAHGGGGWPAEDTAEHIEQLIRRIVKEELKNHENSYFHKDEK